MKFKLLLVLLLSVSNNLVAQERPKNIYLELGGSGGVGSINYEQQFYRSTQVQLYWRAGFSVAPIDRNNGTGLVFPVMVHLTYGNAAHKLDAGLGQGITLTTKGKFFSLTTAAVGYRLEPVNSRLFFRFSYTPLISYLVDFQVQHWAGISIGYHLK